MAEMKKTSKAYCGKCKYLRKLSSTEEFCRYIEIAGKSRGCPVGMCDKFESKGRKRKEKTK